MYRNWDFPDDPTAGEYELNLSYKKTQSITVTSHDSDYRFAISYVKTRRISGSPNPGGSSPPNYCDITPIQRPAPQNVSGHDWTMRAEITDKEGLVLSNVRLRGRMMSERISVPYYNIQTSSSELQLGELRLSDTSGTLRSRLVS